MMKYYFSMINICCIKFIELFVTILSACKTSTDGQSILKVPITSALKTRTDNDYLNDLHTEINN